LFTILSQKQSGATIAPLCFREKVMIKYEKSSVIGYKFKIYSLVIICLAVG
jgi:hypothetical protein